MSDPETQLDQWLSAARWPAPDGEAEARLAKAWSSAMRRQRVLANLRVTARIAAAIAIVATLAMSVRWATRPGSPQTSVVPAVSNRVVLLSRVVDAPLPPPREPPRKPTPLESAILRAAAKPRGVIGASLSSTRSAPSVPGEIERQLRDSKVSTNEREKLLRSLLTDGSNAAVQVYLRQVIDPATRATALAALGSFGPMPVDELIKCLNDPRVDVRMAAARTLGKIDGPVLTKRLADMVERDQNRREALIALAASDGPEAKAFVRRAAQSGPLVSATRAVLSRGNFQ